MKTESENKLYEQAQMTDRMTEFLNLPPLKVEDVVGNCRAALQKLAASEQDAEQDAIETTLENFAKKTRKKSR